MDHRHFEEYLLNDAPIPREGKVAFQAHLKVCAKCAALHEANRALHNVVMAAPAPGFASRFQAKLAARRKAQRRRHILGGLILLVGALGLGFWLVLPILPTMLFSPSTLLVSWGNTLASTFSLLRATVEAGGVILRVAAGFIPAEAWLFMLSVFGLLSFGWMLSIQKVTRLPQAV